MEQLVSVSVQVGSSYVSLYAWPQLSVRGLSQRLLAACGTHIDPGTVELHLESVVLPPGLALGTALARWRKATDNDDVVRLKCLIPRHAAMKSNAKVDTRGPPLHTVRQVVDRALAALALPAGRARQADVAEAASELCLLPHTFTNWTDAWETDLMEVAVRLARDLLDEKPAAAASVFQACAELLDLPTAFAPRGHLYAALCTLRLHTCLLRVAHPVWQAGSTAAGCCVDEGQPQVVSGPHGRGRGGREGKGGDNSSSGGSRGGRGGGGLQARLAREREAALAAQLALLAKAAGRVGPVLEQISRYDSELSALLDSYTPPSPPSARSRSPSGEQQPQQSQRQQLQAARQAMAPGGRSRSTGVGGSGARGAGTGASAGPGMLSRGVSGSGRVWRDLRVQVAEALEPYAAVQLLDASGRLVAVRGPSIPPAAPFHLPPGTLPSGWDSHRSLFHAILELCGQAGVGAATTAGPAEGFAGEHFEHVPHGAGQAQGGLAGEEAGGRSGRGAGGGDGGGACVATMELPLVARTLDDVLQLHARAHAGCGGGASSAGPAAAGDCGERGGARNGTASERHDSSDLHDRDDGSSEDSASSSDSSSSSSRPPACPRTPAFSQLPPCLDWLQDITAVLEAACDVYSLAGGSDTDTDAEVGAEGSERAEEAAGVEGADGAGSLGLRPSALHTAVHPAAAGMAAVAHVVAPAAATAVGETGPAGSSSSSSRTASGASGVSATAAPFDGSLALLPVTAAAGAAGASSSSSGSARAGSRVPPRSSDGGAAAAGAGPGVASPIAPSTPLGHPPASREVAAGLSEQAAGPSASLPAAATGGTLAASAQSFNGILMPVPDPLLLLMPARPDTSSASSADNGSGDSSSYSVPEEGSSGALLAPPSPIAPATPQPAPPAAAGAATTAAAAAVKAGGGSAAAAPATAPPSTPSQASGPSASTAHPPSSSPSTSPGPAPACVSARVVVLDSLLRALQCPCLVEQLLAAGSARSGELCRRSVWRHPRLAGCALAAAYQKQALENLLRPLSYMYEDDYSAPLVTVCRSDLLATSVDQLMQYSPAELAYEGICISFEDEQAYGDGVLREWLTEVASAVFDPHAGLFRLAEGDVRALHPSPAGCQQDNHLDLVSFAGRVLGLAMRARVPLGFHLSSALVKLLQNPGPAGRARLGWADLAQLEPRVAATCAQIAAAAPADVEALGLTFVASCGHLGLAHEVPLLPGGEDLPVTAANRRDYLDRLARFYCTWGCSSEHGAPGGEEAGGAGGAGWDEAELDVVDALAQGLADALLCDEEEEDPVAALAARLQPISGGALNAVLGGETGRMDVAAWRNHTSAPAFKSDKEKAALESFWSVVTDLDPEEQRRLLQFWTGISHLPAGGFKNLSQQLQLVPARPEGEAAAGSGAAAGGGAPGTSGGQDTQLEAASGAPSGSAAAEADGGSAPAEGAGPVAAAGTPSAQEGQVTGGGVAAAPLSVSAGSDSGTGSSYVSSSNSSSSSHSSGGAGSDAGGGSRGASSTGMGAEAEAEAGIRGGTSASDESSGSGGGGGGGGGLFPCGGPLLLAAHTCFFQLRLPLLGDRESMRAAVAESLANLGAFWNE